MNRATTGFTLIELLVVISLIGMLASVILASLRTARIKAEEATVRLTIRDLKIASLSYYYSKAKFPHVPVSEGAGVGFDFDADQFFEVLRSENHISALPNFPVGTSLIYRAVCGIRTGCDSDEPSGTPVIDSSGNLVIFNLTSSEANILRNWSQPACGLDLSHLLSYNSSLNPLDISLYPGATAMLLYRLPTGLIPGLPISYSMSSEGHNVLCLSRD